ALVTIGLIGAGVVLGALAGGTAFTAVGVLAGEEFSTERFVIGAVFGAPLGAATAPPLVAAPTPCTDRQNVLGLYNRRCDRWRRGLVRGDRRREHHAQPSLGRVWGMCHCRDRAALSRE